MLKFELPWDSQPQEVVELNRDLGITPELLWLGSTPAVDLQSGAPWTRGVSLTDGVGLEGKNTSSIFGTSTGFRRSGGKTTAQTRFTYIGIATRTGTGAYQGLVGSSDAASGFAVADIFGAGNQFSLVKFGIASINAPLGLALNEPTVIVISHRQDTGEYYALTRSLLTGVRQRASTTNASASNAGNGTYRVMGAGTAGAWNGSSALAVMSFDFLPETIGARILDDPWGMLFAPRSIWVPVSAGGGSATDLTIQEATHAHTADSPTLTVTTSTDLTVADATHAHAADSLTLSIVTVTSLTIADAAHAHTADNLTLTTTGAVDLTIADATHGHSADSLTLTLGYVDLTVADALHGHTADSLTLSVTGATNLTIDDATHGHTADSLTLTLGYIDLIVADALHAHEADSLTLTTTGSLDLVIARAVHNHTVDNLTLTFPLGALSDAEFREMYDWVKELHRIHGLTSGSPLVVTPTTRSTDTISQTIGTVGTTVTVTRV